MDDRLLTIDEVAQYLGVHRDTVYSMVRTGKLPAMQLGGRKAGWRISQKDFSEFIESGKARMAAITNGSLSEAEPSESESFDKRQADELKAFEHGQRAAREEFFSERSVQ